LVTHVANAESGDMIAGKSDFARCAASRFEPLGFDVKAHRGDSSDSHGCIRRGAKPLPVFRQKHTYRLQNSVDARSSR
jgi:hypothetical protein